MRDTDTAPTLVPPDLTTVLPRLPFTFTEQARDDSGAALADAPDALFRRLLHERETELAFLLARHVLDAFLNQAVPPAGQPPEGADTVAARVAEVRAELAPAIDALAGTEPEVRTEILAQRAPIGLLSGCWLDAVSQPATQPAVIVNRLFAQHFTLRGNGNRLRSTHHLRAMALELAGVDLPGIAAADFLPKVRARPLTVLHGCFYLALSVLPANFLPELIGVHYAFHALGTDDRLLGTAPTLSESTLRELLAEYLAQAGPPQRQRMDAAVALTLALEREHVAMLTELAHWRGTLSLESRVAEIIARHAPLAGSQHGRVRVGGTLLSDTFADIGQPANLVAFLGELRESGYLRALPDGGCRLVDAMKFGGPMFGIFAEREAATVAAWARTVRAGDRPEIRISTNTVGDLAAARWHSAIRASSPQDVVFSSTEPSDDRELFHRLVNIENFPGTLRLARQRARGCFDAAEILFQHGAGGRYTDATFFEYRPEALYARAERVYWEKLVDPYRPLVEIPDRDEVLFRQTTYHLTYLVDGAWLHRLGQLGRRERDSDDMLFAIYADEMGNGDLRKNHLTLTRRAMASMGINLPHIREAAFLDQDDLPDDLYGFPIQQLCMCLFPDRFYNEILGYNLAIEMYGSGEVRLHEIQKLRYHGFDDCYEQAHLTIDNFSAGHAKQAADIIVSYLDQIRRTAGDGVVPGEWRRIWRGYASFAYFVEQPLLNTLAAFAEQLTGDEPADVVI
jgi:Iron-containing redox enzyme